MKSNQILLMILIAPFFLVSLECRVISRLDGDKTLRKKEKHADLSKQNHFEGDIFINAGYSAVYENRLWPNNRIPYVISTNYNQDETNMILDAMTSIQSRTCIQFIPRTTELDYINIYKAGLGCGSYEGRIGGNQKISLDDGCLTPSLIKHELIHAIGFWHEQSRTDRDDYVTINTTNIEDGVIGQFQKFDAKTVQLLGTPYDIKSIMHYPWYAFAKDPNVPAIYPKNGPGIAIEPSEDLTLTDILDINLLYKCPKDPYLMGWKEKMWNNGRFAWNSDCDFVGANNILQVKSKQEDCGGLCVVNWKCTHFTWESNGICSLKKAPKSAVTRPLKGAMCGYVVHGNSKFPWNDGKELNTWMVRNGLDYQWNTNCDFIGNDIRVEVKSDSPGFCFRLCNSDPKCTHNSWVSEGSGSALGTCSLKTGKTPVAQTTINFGFCAIIPSRI